MNWTRRSREGLKSHLEEIRLGVRHSDRMKRSRESLRLEDVSDAENESHQIDPLSFPLEVQLEEDFILPKEHDTMQEYVGGGGNQLRIISAAVDSDDDDGGIACEFCGRRFPNIVGLRTHKRSHKDDAVNLGQALYKSPQYSVHEEKEDADFSCDICKRSFPNIYGLRTHERYYGHGLATDPDIMSKQKRPLPKTKCIVLSRGTITSTKHRIVRRSAQVNETSRSAGRLNQRPIRPKAALSHAPSQPQQSEEIKADPRNLRGQAKRTDDPLALPTIQNNNVLNRNSNHVTESEDISESEAWDGEAYESGQGQGAKGGFSAFSALQEYPIFTKAGMFYACTLCDHRNLHINGIRAHWNRHVREGKETLKTS